MLRYERVRSVVFPLCSSVIDVLTEAGP